jgi:threonyl-tRNA synthetase
LKRFRAILEKAQKSRLRTSSYILAEKELYVTSGHYANMSRWFNNKYSSEGEFLKPMNCPHHCEIYNVRPWSYKDLPKRYADLELYTCKVENFMD